MSDLSIGSDLIHGYLVAFGFSPGPPEMLLLLVIALLLYGGKLPEMARSWGKSLAEFRRGLSGIQSELNDVIYSASDQLEYQPELNSYSDSCTDSCENDSDSCEEDSEDEFSEETCQDDSSEAEVAQDDGSSVERDA